MITFFIICVSVITLVILYNQLTKKYVNPFTLTFVFAKKGQGKSTLLTKWGIEYQRRGWTVYSTEPIPGAFLIDYSDIGTMSFPEFSVIIVDEVGMVWDARDFKSFPKEVRNFFKLQRHYKLRVILASQTFDVDKKIRDLADDMFLLEKKFRVFSYGKRIIRRLTILEAQGGSESRITDNMQFDSFLFFWAGSRILTFIPAWTGYFDSFQVPELQHRDFQQIPDLTGVTQPRRKRSRRGCVTDRTGTDE